MRIVMLILICGCTWAQDVNPIKELGQVIQQKGTDEARALFERYREEGKLSFWPVNALGQNLLAQGLHEEAIAVFGWNLELDQQGLWGRLSLAEAYRVAADKKKALETVAEVKQRLEKGEWNPRLLKAVKTQAERLQLMIEHFRLPADSNLRVTSHYGGGPAGLWDAENLVAFAEGSQDVHPSYQSYNLYAAPIPSIAAGIEDDQADVVLAFLGGDFRRYIRDGKLADLASIWKAKNWDSRFSSNFKRMGSYDGKPYFVPMAYQANPIWYRKDIFDQHGLKPPKTWDEMRSLIRRLNELELTPFSISVAQWPPPVARWFTILNLRLNGPEFHESLMQLEVAYTDPRVKNVFGYWAQLFELGAFAADSADNTYAKGVVDLYEGKAVMYLLGEWLFESKLAELGDKLDFFPFPPIKDNVAQAEIVHVYGACMLQDTPNRARAVALLDYLAGEQSQSSNARELKRTQPNRNLDRSLYTPVQRRLIELVEEADVLVPLYEFNTHPKLARAGLAAFSKFWRDQSDVDGLLAELEKVRQEVRDHGNR